MNIFLEGTTVAARMAVTAESAAYATSFILIMIELIGDSVGFMNENTGFVGGALGICTFLMSWYYKRRGDKRSEERTERTRHDDE